MEKFVDMMINLAIKTVQNKHGWTDAELAKKIKDSDKTLANELATLLAVGHSTMFEVAEKS